MILTGEGDGIIGKRIVYMAHKVSHALFLSFS